MNGFIKDNAGIFLFVFITLMLASVYLLYLKRKNTESGYLTDKDKKKKDKPVKAHCHDCTASA